MFRSCDWIVIATYSKLSPYYLSNLNKFSSTRHFKLLNSRVTITSQSSVNKMKYFQIFISSKSRIPNCELLVWPISYKVCKVRLKSISMSAVQKNYWILLLELNVFLFAEITHTLLSSDSGDKCCTAQYNYKLVMYFISIILYDLR